MEIIYVCYHSGIKLENNNRNLENSQIWGIIQNAPKPSSQGRDHQKKIKNTLRGIEMKTQHSKSYATQLKQCLEENL